MTAVERFCDLLNEITPGGIEVVEKCLMWQARLATISVPVRTSRVSMLFGREFSSEEIRDLLTPIGFGVEPTDDEDVNW